MFAVLGEETAFCEWVVRLGGAPVEAAGRAVLVAAR
jgi:hypothetical protein